MIIEIHAIQSFPPSNLNRDRAGHPKEAIFGGVRRARISSQAIKRAIRTSPVFANTAGLPIGIRTKRLAAHVVEQLARDGIDADWAEPRAKQTVDKLYTKEDAKKRNKKPAQEGATSEDGAAPLYVSVAETQAIVRFLADAHATSEEPDIQSFCNKQRRALKDETEALDIALFGRMLAGRPELNIEAACQVAHAISTHEVTIPQSDFSPRSMTSCRRRHAAPR
ncbi:MAG: type I-E CRISPR-associated protein Cas7/Cse4/CasC [Anaerolineae bacterium]|nr:type I-E CRISPR-associated protein Cas7/Cse4/CasC [Anaerolineae bacterium]